MRGLKGFQPHHVVGFQDPLFADDPQFWILTGDIAAGAGFFGHIGVQTPDIPDLLTVVDRVVISGGAAETYSVDVVQGQGAVLAALATDAQVTLRNRRDQGANPGFAQRVGLLRISDGGNAIVGQTAIATHRASATTPFAIDLGHRLYRLEQLFVRNTTVNLSVTVTMTGRLIKRT